MTKTHLMLSGGGTNGVQIIGSLKKLYEVKLLDDIKVLGGVSAGAVICTVLCLYDINFIEEMSYNLLSLFEFNLKSLLSKFGLCSKQSYVESIEQYLISKLKCSPTFEELYNYSKKELIIFATNVTKEKLVDFNYKSHPNMKVIDAIKLSINVPLVFEYEEYENDIYVDGGVLSNFPFEYFNNVNNENKIGITTSYKKTKNLKINTNIISYIYSIINLLIKTIENYDNESVIYLNCSLSNLFNFKMTQELFDALLLLGYNQTELYLKNNNYI